MTEPGASEDEDPKRWLQAFPWLAAATDRTTAEWAHKAIDDSDSVSRADHLGAIVTIAMERLDRWTLGEIFPGLPQGYELRLLHLPSRAVNAFDRRGMATTSDLFEIKLGEMSEWRQVGLSALYAILRALADISTQSRTPVVASTDKEGSSVEFSAPESDEASRPGYDQITHDLDAIARWNATTGALEVPLLTDTCGTPEPDRVKAARERLRGLTASELMGGQPTEDVADALDQAFRLLDPRAIDIVASRLLSDKPTTLDELGKRHDVTRERVRQIEGKARGAMLGLLSVHGPIADVAAVARSLIGTIRPLNELVEELPALARTVEVVQQPAWRVIDRLDDAYEIDNGWCVVPTMSGAMTETQSQVEDMADAYGVARIENLSLVTTSDLERHVELTSKWLTHCGYVVLEGYVLTRTSSVGDYGAAVLSIAGTPLSPGEIVDRFVVDRSPGSLRNAMSSDDRFKRVDREKWALSEWGMDAYAGIRSVIREQVSSRGGQVGLEALIEFVTEHYSVTATSVAAYASAAPFACREGLVTLATGASGIRKAPQRTRHLYRRPDNWAYRIRVSSDHLRGSGSVAPIAIAGLLGLQFGETRHLPSPGGPQVVAWTGTQPSFGTIRRFLLSQDVAADDEAFLVVFDDGTFGFELVRELVGKPLLDALALIGAPAVTDLDTMRDAFASAIALPHGSPISSIIGRYRDRGDGSVAELLMSAHEIIQDRGAVAPFAAQADVEDILDLL